MPPTIFVEQLNEKSNARNARKTYLTEPMNWLLAFEIFGYKLPFEQHFSHSSSLLSKLPP